MAPTAAGGPEGWKGGGLQVRLATRADLGWPLTADEKDAGEHFAHLTLWYYQPQRQPCLHLAFGMDLHGGTTLTHPNGFEGAYRKDADGRGYVLEYAVPWQLLKAAPPADGSRMGLNWSVLWSDEKGSDWRAKLVDLINPDFRPNETTVATYQKAATWGQGVYLLGAK
jgi:hypothetical protein